MTDANPALERDWGAEWATSFDLTVDRPASPALVGAAVGVAALFDLAVRSEIAALSATVCILAAAVVLLASRRVTNPHAVALIACAPVFGIFLTVRTSDWLIPLNVLAAAGLLGYGASLARGGSIFDLTIPDVVTRAVRGALHALGAPAFLLRGVFGARGTSRAGGIVRGLLIVTPLVLILGALLSSADAVFASFFDVDTGEAWAHAALIAIGLVTFGGLVRMASSAEPTRLTVAAPKLGMLETGIVLVALNLLLAAFAVARIVALSEGGQRVLRSAGVTYAEYARSGFFQLLAVAVIVIATLLVLRAIAQNETRAHRRAFSTLSFGVVALTLAVCVSAFHRLVLYEGAFGLTMLRVFVQTAIVWVGIVLILLGIAVVRPPDGRAWLAPAAAIAALVLLFAMNVFDPEAFVARHNVANLPATERLDTVYLSQLSDDAVPALAGTVGEGLCGSGSRSEGWASFNMSRSRAQDVRDRICDHTTGGSR